MTENTCEPLSHAGRASSELLQTEVAALHSTRAMQEICDRCPFLMIVLDEHRQIVYCNQPVAKAVGADGPAELIGKRPGEIIGCVHAGPAGCGNDEACCTCGALMAVLEAQRGRNSMNECRITSVIGGREVHFDFSVNTAPLDLDGRRFVVFSLSDISHEKRRRALERIFFHDVINTAGGVQGLARLLQESLPEGEAAQMASQIGSAAEVLLADIESHRQLAAAEAGELRVQLSTIYTADLLQRLVTRYAVTEDAQGKEIRVAEDSIGTEMVTDVTILDRVLGNMLKNALESTPRGCSVTIGCRASEAGFVEFWVHNPGYIPRKVQLQVFQRSFSTKGVGRGLGTYSMKLLSERYLGGIVSFRSSQEEGTEFSARFPLQIEQA